VLKSDGQSARGSKKNHWPADSNQIRKTWSFHSPDGPWEAFHGGRSGSYAAARASCRTKIWRRASGGFSFAARRPTFQKSPPCCEAESTADSAKTQGAELAGVEKCQPEKKLVQFHLQSIMCRTKTPQNMICPLRIYASKRLRCLYKLRRAVQPDADESFRSCAATQKRLQCPFRLAFAQPP